MSAIAGLCRPHAPLDETAIGAMLDALDHWRADARSSWTSRSCALGHLLLATTPEAYRERLPLHDADGELAITADARLDNRADLAHALDIAPADLPSWPDGRLLLHAFRKWRHDCVRHLQGDFAFAVWDGTRDELFCARDKFGVRPFYYATGNATFAFASEIKGLLALPGIDRSANEQWIADYLHRLIVDRGATFYRGVRKLEAAHAMVIGPAGSRQWRYWSLDPSRELPPASDQEYVELFRHALVRAVTRRAGSPLPIGAELSGGLDSAAICAIAQRDLQGHGSALLTFSQVRPDGLPDMLGRPRDLRWAVDLLVNRLGITDALRFAGDGGVLDALEWSNRYADEPVTSFVCFDNASLYEAARARGVGVMLSGFGGNAAVSATAREITSELLRSGAWIELWRELSSGGRHPLRRLPRLLLAQLDTPAAGPLVRRWHHWVAHPHRVTNGEFARRMRMWRRTLEYGRAAEPRGTLRQRAIRALETGTSRRLEEEARWCRARRFEFRYPLLDEDLVSTWLAMPSRMKHRDGVGRYVMREALSGLVPDEIRLERGGAGSGNPGALARKQRDEDELMRRLRALPPAHRVFDYIDLHRVFTPPPIPQRVPRHRHTEMLQTLMLARWLEASG